jgi:hypothetical protein
LTFDGHLPSGSGLAFGVGGTCGATGAGFGLGCSGFCATVLTASDIPVLMTIVFCFGEDVLAATSSQTLTAFLDSSLASLLMSTADGSSFLPNSFENNPMSYYVLGCKVTKINRRKAHLSLLKNAPKIVKIRTFALLLYLVGLTS